MSRFIDQLKRAARTTPQSMGFRAGKSVSSEPHLLLMASLAQTADTDAAEAVAGADAVLLRPAKADLAVKALQKIADSLPDIPWGVWLEDPSAKKVAALVDAGGDFVVFPAASRASGMPGNDRVGKILQVDPSLGDSFLRAVNDLPVDALLAAPAYEADDALTWHHLMLFQRLANLITKPLMAAAPPKKVTAGELKTLWDVGVDGVVVETGPGQPPDMLRELQKALGEMTFPPSRKRGRGEVRLPYMGVETSTITEEEEE